MSETPTESSGPNDTLIFKVKSIEVKEHRLKRWLMVILSVLAISAVVSVIAAVISVNQTFRPLEPSLVYVGSWAMVTPVEVCPGDVVQLRINVEVDRTPVVIEIAESWWSISTGSNVVLGDRAHYSVVTAPEKFTSVLTATVPPGLMPGAYEYRRAAWQRFAATQAFALPFTVKDKCQ